MAKVPLYDGENCIGRVTYTDNLDFWDGSNYTSGSTGRHKGVGKTRSGQFYFCYGTQWQGERDSAEIVTEAEARAAVMARNDEALYEQLFGESIPDLDA